MGSGMRVSLAAAVVAAALALSPLYAQESPGPRPAGPTFRAGVDLVTVTAVVRDGKGRAITTLSRDDFELFDAGQRRPITEFRADQAPVTMAVLFDASGSMEVAAKVDAARRAADHLLAWLVPGRDEIALYTFDTALHEMQPFTRNGSDLQRSLKEVSPFGATSLHDAIAETARRVAARGGSHRAVVVLTDGLDNYSRLTPPEVSGIASSIDVPVYVISVVSPLDDPSSPMAVAAGRSPEAKAEGELTDLAHWTGGEFFVASAPSQESIAARTIVTELRTQYLIAFEPGSKPGWHPLELRTRDKKLAVRARSGYIAGHQQPAS